MIDAHQVTTISMSFGMPYDDGMTASDMAAWDRPMQQAALTGISTFASSGDSGNNSTANDLGAGGAPDGLPHIGYPASSAYTTAVGGTSVGMLQDGSNPVNAGWEDKFFNQADPTKASFTEITNHSIYGAGGGVSAVSAQPSWQKGVVTTSSTMRAVPDVAALADPYTGYTIRFRSYNLDQNGNPTASAVSFATYGGTSLASPITAAIIGLAKSYNNSTIGLAAPKLYSMRHSAAITDINQADRAGVYFKSSVWGPEVVAFDAKPENLVSARGWDNVTGVGSPNGMKFIRTFK
ncbi:S8 family serine peptidase [Calidifontibacter terrae]